MTADPLSPDLTALRRRLFAGSPVIAIARGVPWNDLQRTASALVRAGFPAIEVTLDSPEALDHLARLRQEFAGDLSVGAGTVRSVEAAERATDAGAAFLVSATSDPAVISWAVGAQVAMIPGTLTPTEIEQALRAGATAVKIFPAGPLGPGYVRSILGPLPEAPIVATGGIANDEVADWLRGGATAVGLGGALFGGSSQKVADLLGGMAVELAPWRDA